MKAKITKSKRNKIRDASLSDSDSSYEPTGLDESTIRKRDIKASLKKNQAQRAI